MQLTSQNEFLVEKQKDQPYHLNDVRALSKYRYSLGEFPFHQHQSTQFSIDLVIPLVIIQRLFFVCLFVFPLKKKKRVKN